MHLMRLITRSDELPNPKYGRSGIGAEGSILIPINSNLLTQGVGHASTTPVQTG